MSQFSLEMQKFANLTKKQMVTVTWQSIFDFCSSVVYSTPVDTGQLRNNWFPSIGLPSGMETTDVSPGGEEVISRLNTELATFEPGIDFWYANNKPYGPRIEYEGYSAKAPQGMVRINVLRWPEIVATNAQGVK